MIIGLVGWGVETKDAYKHFGDSHQYVLGNEEPSDDFPTSKNVTIFALSEKRPPGLVGNVSDLSYLDHYDDCDLVIYQGATRKNLEKKFPENDPFWSKAKTIQHIFFEESPTKNIVGVTGTKGKGTTSSLIALMLQGAGLRTYLAGNIGSPTLDLLPKLQADDWVVLELSNFQLYKFPYSPHIAVHLMMMPEHINEWHKTMDDYVAAKRNIFAHQTESDIAVFLPSNRYSKENVGFSIGKHMPYTTAPGARVEDDFIVIDNHKIIAVSEVKLLGAHNLDNICAAVTAVWSVTKDVEAIAKVISTFTGLEHRLELAGEHKGVKYYDDSFGTTPDTAIVAMDAFKQKKVMIVGGHDKGNPFEEMAERLVADDIKHVIFIGVTGKKLLEMAQRAGFKQEKATIRENGNSWTMTAIVDSAMRQSEAGDIVLLSTGCASFGLFKDYKDRGDQFQEAVKKLG